MGYVLSLEIIQYWSEYMQKTKTKTKNKKQKQKQKKQKQKECIICMYVVSFSFEHVYVCGDFLLWVYLSMRVCMWAPWDPHFNWSYVYVYFLVRIWVTHAFFVRKASDLSLRSLDLWPIHHSIHFFMWILSMLWCGSTSTHISLFLFLLISLCYFFQLYCILSLHFFPHLAWCLIWGTYLGHWLMRFPMHCISHMRGMVLYHWDLWA